MHELPIIKTIYKTVIDQATRENANKVLNVYLEIGELRDFIPDLLKKYWAYVTKDSIASESNLLIREIKAKAKCGKCGEEYYIDTLDVENSKCPKCGYDMGELIQGRELVIYGIQIE